MADYWMEWASLLLRWLHVITAIAWIGSSFYFVWLDLFSDEAAMAAGAETWTGSELEAKWNAMGTCESFAFAASAIRR